MKKIIWRDIVGHEEVKKLLQNYAARNDIAHSFLMLGSKGIGKRKIVFNFIRALVCSKEDSPCGECINCRMVEKGISQYVFYEKSNDSIKLDYIRDLISKMSLVSSDDKYRFIIIDGVERLTVEAANALLKILEEPGNKVIFIFLADNLKKVLATIRSRCLLIRFDKLSFEESKMLLPENLNGFKENELINIMLGRADLLNKIVKLPRDTHYKNVNLFWTMLSADLLWKFNFVKKLVELDDDKILGLLFLWESCMRDYLLWKMGAEKYLWWNDEKIIAIYRNCGVSYKIIYDFLYNLSRIRLLLKKGINKKIQLYGLLLNFH